MPRRRAPEWFYISRVGHSQNASSSLDKLQEVQEWLRKADTFHVSPGKYDENLVTEKTSQAYKDPQSPIHEYSSQDGRYISQRYTAPAHIKSEHPLNHDIYAQPRWTRSNKLQSIPNVDLNSSQRIGVNGAESHQFRNQPLPKPLPTINPQPNYSSQTSPTGMSIPEWHSKDTSKNYRKSTVLTRHLQIHQVPFSVHKSPECENSMDYYMDFRKYKRTHGRETTFSNALIAHQTSHLRTGFGPIQRPHTPVASLMDRQKTRFRDTLRQPKSPTKAMADQQGRTYTLHSQLKDMLKGAP